MRNIFTAIILGIVLAGVSFAQTSSKALQRAGNSTKPRVAVVEFSPGPNASGMTAEAKRQLQSSIAFSLFQSGKFDVPDVRNTRAATQGAVVGTSAAVKIGKQLGASYVLIGSVTEYSPNPGGNGRITLKTQLVEVATGKVKHSGDATGQSARAMTSGAGHAEMSAKVVKPCIEKLTASLTAVGL